MKKLFTVEQIANDIPYEVWSMDEPLPEIYADGTEGILISDGIVKINLCSSVIEQSDGHREPKRKKIVTKRLVMPTIRFFELLDRGIQARKMLQQQQQDGFTRIDPNKLQ